MFTVLIQNHFKTVQALINATRRRCYDASIRSDNQEISRILWNPTIHCRSHDSPPAVPSLTHTSPEHTCLFYSLDSNFNVTLLSTSFRQRFTDGHFISTSHVSQSVYRLATGRTVQGSKPGGGGARFLHPSRRQMGLTQPPIQWVPGLSRG